MLARHAVLLTPPRSSHPRWSLCRQHSAPISPLTATLMGHLASVANKRLTAQLNPFRCNTYKKHRGDSLPLPRLATPLISRHCTKPFLFKPLRTLLQSSRTQLVSFQSFTYSLPNTPRVGGTHQSLPHYLLASLSRFPQSPACPDLVGVINRCIIPPREHPSERSRMPCPGLPHRKRNHPPEYYPLSLNALVNACNQKSNRDPVMNLDEAAVRQALHSLDGQSLVRSVSA